MGLLRRNRFQRVRSGEFRLRLAPDERAMLASLPDQLEALLRAGEHGSDAGSATARLFPPAYGLDAERNAEYQRLMGDELRSRRLASLAMVRETVGESVLTEEQLHTWARVLNDARLVLGTLLDVSEDTEVLDAPPDAPDAAQRVLYVILSAIVDEAVAALSTALPPPTQT